MDDWKNDLIEGDEAKIEYKKRILEYQPLKISQGEKENFSNKPDCTIIRETKNLCYVHKAKKKDEILEDKVWTLFYKMGFTKFNSGRQFEIHWSDKPGESKQIDVFCADEETVLLAECKKGYANSCLKENIESYKGILPEIKQSILRVFPGVKIAFLYVTEDYNFGEEDNNRLEALNNILPAYHFNEKALENYRQLVDQIGTAAKYQLLGLLFKGRRIKNLENKVNAIEGKMGGLTYYSFTMKPSQLLKMAYVLHRNNVNSTDDMMPSYQRIIKKDRLKKIREFIEHKKGYFPNAIIVSIRTKNENDKTLEFQPAAGQDSSSLSRIGTVILPQEYQTAYVIDGQHRLYGYSSTSYADKNSIPVIAFVNMKKEEQVQMFMDINQNQKAVPKVLRDTLEADLLYTSNTYSLVNNAIKKRIAMKLGEKPNSPLYGMVLTGENPSNDNIPLTIDGIFKALNKTTFFNLYNKQNQITSNGLFDYGIDKANSNSKEKTESIVFEFIVWTLKKLKKEAKNKWNSTNGFLISNNLIGATICLLNDFVLLAVKNNQLSNCHPSLESTEKAVEPFVNDLCQVLVDFTNSANDDLRKFKGDGGLKDAWQWLGAKINKRDSNFNPDWMQDYLDKYCQENCEEAKEILLNIGNESKKIIRKELKKINFDNWENGISEKVACLLNDRQFREKRQATENNQPFDRDLLEFADFSDLNNIVKTTKNSAAFGKRLFKLNQPDVFSQYDRKTGTLEILNALEKTVSSGKNLSKIDFDDIKKYKEFINELSTKEEL